MPPAMLWVLKGVCNPQFQRCKFHQCTNAPLKLVPHLARRLLQVAARRAPRVNRLNRRPTQNRRRSNRAMKTGPRRDTLKQQRFRPRPLRPAVRRETVARCDLTDCLLQAYEFVARRAYEKFLMRGGESGKELEDWLSAEREM